MEQQSHCFNIILYGFKFCNITYLSQLIGLAYQNKDIKIKIREFTQEPIPSPEICHIRIGKKIFSSTIPKKECDILIGLELIGMRKIALDYLRDNGRLIINNNPLLKDDYIYQFPTFSHIEKGKDLNFALDKFPYNCYFINIKEIQGMLNDSNIFNTGFLMLGIFVDKLKIFPLLELDDIIKNIVLLPLRIEKIQQLNCLLNKIKGLPSDKKIYLSPIS